MTDICDNLTFPIKCSNGLIADNYRKEKIIDIYAYLLIKLEMKL